MKHSSERRSMRHLCLERLDARKLFAGLTEGRFDFATTFEEQSIAEWQHRPNGGGWNLNGTGGFVNIGSGKSIALVETPLATSGSKAMQMTFTQDENMGVAEVSIPGRGVDVVRTAQQVYFEQGFDFAQGMKIHRLYASDGDTTKLDVIVVLWGKPTGQLPGGGNDMSGVNDTYEISIGSNGSKDGPEFDWPAYSSSLVIERGRWYEIESEIKLNTVGQADGEARLWIDGKLVVEKTGISMRKTDDWGINRVAFGGWYSNSGANNPARDPANPSVWYIDDVQVQGGDSFTNPPVMNHSPTLTVPGTIPAKVGQSVDIQLIGNDQDGDSLSYSFVGNVPAGMTIDESSGLITWQPHSEHAGKLFTVRVAVADDSDQQASTFGELHVEVEQSSSHQVGVFRNGSIFLDTGANGYQNEQSFQFGLPGDQVIAGDWDGDGFDEIGVFRNGWFYLDVGSPGYDGETPIQFGLRGDIAIAGDWNGDGIDDVGVYRNGWFFLDDGTRGYNGEQPFRFGPRGLTPIAGDWDGDGIDEVGVFAFGRFLLDEGPRGMSGESWFRFGDFNAIPIAGDWDGDGRDTVGSYQPGRLFSSVKLDLGRRGNSGEQEFQFGLRGDKPMAGRWRTENEAVFSKPEAVDEFMCGNPWDFLAEEVSRRRRR